MSREALHALSGVLVERVALEDGTSAFALVTRLDGASVQITGPVTVSNEVEVKNDAGSPVPVNISGEVEVKNDSGNPLSVAIAGTPTVTGGGAMVAGTRLVRPANTTAYAANGAIGAAAAALITLPGFFSAAGSHALLTEARLVVDGIAAVPSGMAARLHLYNADPSAALASAADQAVYKTLAALSSNKLGYIDFTSFAIGGAGSDMAESYGAPVVSPLHLVAGASTTLYGLLVSTAAWTPVAGMGFQVYAKRAGL